ncbi:xanthine dehydrogenase accessory protein XdhC [Aestuariivirga litoralis]|uniref:xanthine dehydrogenase accessory protein XdhC n=1 Tax=Aestuariivirga litoralis TaxID=2650924 RepID=UPI0018C47948|nr:xanthine dehydrogenase accessory protein XdhC [Aestuariivirga litoralis]MBG1232630.1 xanthine dehydrogenase accessory protein XdhC [Aestuariivirga litoralis]
MNIWAKAAGILESGAPCVMVEVTKAEGSTPREAGAKMLVTPRGYSGTIGGGTLEWHAMAEAQAMLGKPGIIRTMTRSLGPDLGQCCGGRVSLRLQSLTIADMAQVKTMAEAELEDLTHLNLWGGGHVGRALVLALAPLAFRITWWDQREGAFPAYVPENVICRAGGLDGMKEGGLVLIMTHNHNLDFEIADFALRQDHFFRVGMIGSDTKSVRFRKRLAAAGHNAEALERLVCPIGSKAIHSKLPPVIAATVAVQLLEWQQMLKTVEFPVAAPQHLDKVMS